MLNKILRPWFLFIKIIKAAASPEKDHCLLFEHNEKLSYNIIVLLGFTKSDFLKKSVTAITHNIPLGRAGFIFFLEWATIVKTTYYIVLYFFFIAKNHHNAEKFSIASTVISETSEIFID